MDTIETVMIATTPCAAAWRRRRAPRNRAGQVEGAAGALGVEEDGRAADGLAAHGAGKGAVEQRVAAGGERRGRWHVVLRLRHGLMTVDQLP